MKRIVLTLLIALATPEAVLAQEKSDIASLETQFDRAVSRVSRPAGVLVFGLPGTRSYRVGGLGIVFVLPPRALDVGRREVRIFRPRGPQPAGVTLPEEELQVIEQQVLIFAGAAESTRREAERHADAVERQVRTHLEPGRQPQDAQSTQTQPALAPPAGSLAASGGDAPPPSPPAAPPWLVWLQDRDEGDSRPPERIVEDVVTAVIQTLEVHGARASGIRPQDSLVVAVDFVSPEVPFAPPERLKTLVVRVQKQALLDKARGRITQDQLRQAMVVEVY